MNSSRITKFGARKVSRGFTLLELMVVISIIAVVIIAVVGRISSTKQASQVNSEVSNIQTIVASANSLVTGQQTYAGLTNAGMLAVNGFPLQMVSGTTVSDAWNGTVTVLGNAASSNAKGEIDYTGVPQGACIALVGQIAKAVDTVTVGATVLKSPTVPLVSTDNITTACGASTALTILFTQ
jgi:prepilin-type N-terminal cleavage/methylation domain-containing protein